MTPKLEKATFAAGCFWGVEAYFKRLKGVKSTTVGYTGGWLPDVNYQLVRTGKTGHAESVKIEFDPKVITYKKLLDHFWKVHDPTSLNKQGNDRGTQYRSAIFVHTVEQERAALKAKENLERSKRFKKKIVTEIARAGKFYPAEEYHQDYLDKNPGGYCHVDLSGADK
jgi:methionine-S-sulfoxide reductase